MKPTHFTAMLALGALLAGGASALGQANGVPGPDAYPAFSAFIADRNIFDPTRQPHYTAPGEHHVVRTQSVGLPSIELVGTMVYEKGPFAFFNANDVDNRKAVSVGGQIAGYQVTVITVNSVQLATADKKETHELKIGDGLRQENGKWVFAQADELPPVTGAISSSYSSGSSRRRRSDRYDTTMGYRTTDNSSSSASAPAEPPPSAGAQSDILKRLMQQREKENQ